MNWIKTTSLVFLLTLISLLMVESSVRFFKGWNNEFTPWNKECHPPTLLTSNVIPYYEEDWSCGEVSHIKGKRSTKPDILSWDKTIHVFGGSTAWGAGSIDSETIPSILQSALIKKKIRVINHGFTSLTAFQQNYILQKEKSHISKDDIVIYYDGGNDFWNGVMNGNADGTIVGYNLENKSKLFIFNIKNWLSNNLALYHLLSDIKHGRKKQYKCLTSEDLGRERVEYSAKNYAMRINQAKEFVESIGANFYHFYQPTLLDVLNPTAYEKTLRESNVCWKVASKLKAEYTNIFITESPASHNISTIFSNKNVFSDWIHVSYLGNRIAAKHILDVISK